MSYVDNTVYTLREIDAAYSIIAMCNRNMIEEVTDVTLSDKIAISKNIQEEMCKIKDSISFENNEILNLLEQCIEAYKTEVIKLYAIKNLVSKIKDSNSLTKDDFEALKEIEKVVKRVLEDNVKKGLTK